MMGGLLAAIAGMPMGLAFGVLSGLGPMAGIYTAIIMAISASIFGGTKALITGPTGPMTVVAAMVVSLGLANAGNLENAWPLIIGTFVLAGLFELVFGILNFGKYVKNMPYSVFSGIMTGIGIMIISLQIFPLFGHASPHGFLNIMTNIGDCIANLNGQALLLGAITIAIVYGFPKITNKVPSILVALVAGTLVSVSFDMVVPVIGEIPGEFPGAHFSALSGLHWSDFQLIIIPAIMLGGLGMIDSLHTAVMADNLTDTKHNSRWMVIGQGVGNMITGLFGGIPGAGSDIGTVTNIRAGAQSGLSGIMKGIFLLIMVVGVADYVQYIPMPVLAGILITIGIGIIDHKGVKMLLKVPGQDAILWAIVLAVTLFDNLFDALGIGFVLSAILFVRRMSGNITTIRPSGSLQSFVQHKKIPEELTDRIYVKTLEGPLFFGFAEMLRNHCERIENVHTVILRMEHVPFLDQRGVVSIESAIRDWHRSGIQVYLTGTSKQVLTALQDVQVVPELVSEANCFDDFDRCIEAVQDKVNGAGTNYENAQPEFHILENNVKINVA